MSEELATAAEQAGPDQQRELLEAAFRLFYPQPTGPEPEWQGPGTLREPFFHHWKVREVAFFKKLDADAFVDAALEDAAALCDAEFDIHRGDGAYLAARIRALMEPGEG